MKEKNTGTKSGLRKLSPFYIVLAICLCAAGATSYYASNYKIKTNAETTAEETNPTQTLAITDIETAAVGDIVDNVPDTRYASQPENSAAAPEETTAPAAPQIIRAERFMPPMDTDYNKAFSEGAMVQSKTMGDWRTHNGIDYPGATGDPVKAVNNGIVKSVYDDVLWGTVVEIDHGDGLLVKYCGLGRGSTVNAGEPIKINEKVGNLGTIPVESADGIHLHLEFWQDKTAVNPAAFLQNS